MLVPIENLLPGPGAAFRDAWSERGV